MRTATPLLSPAVQTTPPARGVHLGLWIVQVLLAAAFFMSGAMKLTSPLEALAAQMPWVSGSMGGLVRFIGAAEVAGALGLVLPAATRIMPRLTALAASGLATIMVLAALTHLARGEVSMIAINGVLGAMAAFVAWGREKKAPIAARAGR